MRGAAGVMGGYEDGPRESGKYRSGVMQSRISCSVLQTSIDLRANL